MMVEERTYTLDEIEEETGFDRRTIAYYVQQGLLPKVGRRGPRTRYSQLFLNRLRFIRKIRDLQDQGAMGTMTLSEFRDLFRSVSDETIADAVAAGEEPQVLARQSSPDWGALASASDRRRAMVEKFEDLRRTVVTEPSSASLGSRGRPMDPAHEPSPRVEPDEAFAERAYFALSAEPETAEERDTSSGEHHRLTLDALERSADAPVLQRKTAPPPPADEDLREALARLTAVVRRQPRAYLRTTETWTRARVTEELSLSVRGLQDRHLPLLERVAQILRRFLREGGGGF